MAKILVTDRPDKMIILTPQGGENEKEPKVRRRQSRYAERLLIKTPVRDCDHRVRRDPAQRLAAEPVNIGVLYPVTGIFAQIGQACVNAAKLAGRDGHEAGGIKGRSAAPSST